METVPNEEDVRSLTARLAALDEELPERERHLLRGLLTTSLDPLDRRRHVGDGFDDVQLAVLGRLESERGGPATAPPGERS